MTAPVVCTVGGSSMTGVLEVRVTTALSEPARCELRLDGAALDHLGARAEVRVAADRLFAGTVTEVDLIREPDGTTRTRLVGFDDLEPLRHRQSVRSFERVDAVALVGDVAGLVVTDFAKSPVFERVVQHRQSDLELLTETLGRVGLYLTLDDDGARVLSLDGYGPVLDVVPWQLTVRTRAAGRTASRVFGWDPRRAEVLRERAGDGPAALVLDDPARSGDELRAVADGAVAGFTAGAVTLDAVVDGDAALRPGRRIRVLDATHTLTSVTSIVDGDGFRSIVSTRPPRRPVERPASTLTLGVVTAVDDPDGCGRIRVVLPAYDGLDCGWAAVVAAGAGAGRGLVVLPDVGDPVLVALPHDASGAAIVLGSLFGANTTPDSGTRRWSMRTAAGQSLVVDDEHRSIRLETAGGSHVELAPDLLRVHAAGDLVLEAPGHGITVRASTVDFERAEVPL